MQVLASLCWVLRRALGSRVTQDYCSPCNNRQSHVVSTVDQIVADSIAYCSSSDAHLCDKFVTFYSISAAAPSDRSAAVHENVTGESSYTSISDSNRISCSISIFSRISCIFYLIHNNRTPCLQPIIDDTNEQGKVQFSSTIKRSCGYHFCERPLRRGRRKLSAVRCLSVRPPAHRPKGITKDTQEREEKRENEGVEIQRSVAWE
jgi:hypothetical protein